MVVGKLTPAQCNFVHINQIWKDHVEKETAVGNKWEEAWGFLRDEYHTLTKDITNVRERRGSTDTQPLSRATREGTPLKLPPLKAPKQDTSRPFPTVASREIGWRSSRPECKLEVYGLWGRPKYTITKMLKWPNDSIP